MDRDASLDEFLDVDESPESAEDAADGTTPDVSAGEPGAGGDAPDSGSSAVSDDPERAAIDPARPTGRYEPSGAACDACGTVVERRWREEEAFVCVDCRDW